MSTQVAARPQPETAPGENAAPAAPAPAAGWKPKLSTPTPVVRERVTDKYAAALARPPPPAAPGRTTPMRGVEVTAFADSVAAETEAAAIVTAMTHRPDIQKKLKDAKIELVIIPQSSKMTELPQFAPLHGRSTFDGRPWDDVRGVGGTLTPEGKIAVGIPEENLAHLPSDLYQGTYSVATHELAHVIHEYALTGGERKEVENAFKDRKKANGPWTEAYGASNSHEYFAQATNAFFGRNEGMGHNGQEWLSENDPRIFALMMRVYGEP